MLTIRGASLTGLAAAARLARLGHNVQLGHAHLSIDTVTPVFHIPALWRDLFTKTGRPLAGSTGAAGLELVKAPPARHMFTDGSSLELPTERGAQFYTLQDRYGRPTAEAWRDAIDGLEPLWQALRRFGVEDNKRPSNKAERLALQLSRSIEKTAGSLPHPHLQSIFRSWQYRSGSASSHAPTLLAVPLWLERTFDRWQLVDRAGAPVAGTALVDLLWRRLEERGVTLVDDCESPDLDCRPTLPPKKTLMPRPQPALAPLVTRTEADSPTDAVRETVDHSQGVPIVTWQWGTQQLVHDYTAAHRDLSWGLADDSGKNWLCRIPIQESGTRASACSLAGNHPWSELASGALAAYTLHQRITGVDPHPRNKAFQMPALTRR